MSELEELAARAMALPSRSRAELVEIVIQSLEAKDAETIKAAWSAEIQRRDQEIGAGTTTTRPADPFLMEAREQLH